MEKFTWTDEYNTNIKTIDSQHKMLFEKIDHLALALYTGKSKFNIKDLVYFLDKYIEDHFSLEEHLMKINDYQGFSEHVIQHEKFRKLYGEIKNDFIKKGGDSYLGIRIEKELRKWWENHILKTDMRYVPHLKKIEE